MCESAGGGVGTGRCGSIQRFGPDGGGVGCAIPDRGAGGLQYRSSRPYRLREATPVEVVERIEALRRQRLRMVAFDASKSKSADGTPMSYLFRFGDGSAAVTSSSPTLSYTYTAAGTFEAQVVVTDAYGNSTPSQKLVIKAEVTIDVADSDHAVAAMTVTPTSGVAPLTVSFDGSRSFGADGKAITAYTWNFGDGSPAQTTTAATVAHVYATAGSYSPTLSVMDSASNVSPQKATAQVKANPAAGGSTGGSSGSTSSSSSGNTSGGGALTPGLLLMLLLSGMSRRRLSRGAVPG